MSLNWHKSMSPKQVWRHARCHGTNCTFGCPSPTSGLSLPCCQLSKAKCQGRGGTHWACNPFTDHEWKLSTWSCKEDPQFKSIIKKSNSHKDWHEETVGRLLGKQAMTSNFLKGYRDYRGRFSVWRELRLMKPKASWQEHEERKKDRILSSCGTNF